VKFWLIMFFLTPEGDFISKKEIQYKDKASCYLAMNKVKVKNRAEMVCVSNDHYTGKKQDKNVPFD
jgi:uncharacterized alpha/beta hydrolase family protein